MAKRRNRGCTVLLVFLAILACLASLTGFWLYDRVPEMAREKFGPAHPGLSSYERVLDSVQLLLFQNDLLIPVKTQGEETVFVVEPGESANSVMLRLEKEGLIRNVSAFRVFMIYAGLDTGIQSGTYRFNPGMNPVEIGRKLQNSTPDEVTFVILAGWRAEEVANALAYSGLSFSAGDFMRVVTSPPVDWLPEELRSLTNLEGFLFPGEYVFKRDVSLQEFIQTILGRFNQEVHPDLRAAFERNGLSLQQAVTLASIVQRESVLPEERGLIASVFYNRLAAGMKLDADPTVQYSVGFNSEQNTWWTNPLSFSNLETDSAYNTYIYPGLPPGPICSPSLATLQAVSMPAETPYYYFRAACDGSGKHLFAVTFEEHLNNGCP